jgi:hypothetical protein
VVDQGVGGRGELDGAPGVVLGLGVLAAPGKDLRAHP